MSSSHVARDPHGSPRSRTSRRLMSAVDARRILRAVTRFFSGDAGNSIAGTKGGRSRPGGLPEALLETASVPGHESARFWGDIYTPEFEDALTRKCAQIQALTDSGETPERRLKADFLAISGGGDKGAFAAGLMTGWSERGCRPTFEVVTGVSAGALAAPFVFLDRPRDRCLREIYTEYGASDLYKPRGLRAFFTDALNDTARLDKLLRHYVTDEFLDAIAAEHAKGRRLLVLTTNLDAQRKVIWSMSEIAASDRADRRDLFIDVLKASSALPGIFPPVKIKVVAADGRTYDELHADGGVTAELVFVPPESQILRVEDRFFPQRRLRSLYVIENAKLGPEYQTVQAKLLPLALRAVQTLVKYQVIDNLLALALITRSHSGRFLFNAIPPSFREVSNGAFDRAHAAKLFETGREVGLAGRWFTSPPASPSLVPLEMLQEECPVAERRDYTASAFTVDPSYTGALPAPEELETADA